MRRHVWCTHPHPEYYTVASRGIRANKPRNAETVQSMNPKTISGERVKSSKIAKPKTRQVAVSIYKATRLVIVALQLSVPDLSNIRRSPSTLCGFACKRRARDVVNAMHKGTKWNRASTAYTQKQWCLLCYDKHANGYESSNASTLGMGKRQ